ARVDLFDYLERFHNPRMRRRVARQDQKFSALTQPSVETG
ncbi:MAG: IS3 family transposase, partial [Nevskiales bacterium]